jgi:type II secretory pathway component PulM
LIERFRQLAPREQMVLGIGAALAVVIIAWSFVWMPLNDSVNELRESVVDRSRLMVDLRRAASLVTAGQAGGAPAGSQSLMTIVDATARQLGLADAFPNQRPDGNDLRVTVTDAPFTLIVDWLIGLEREYAVRVREVSLSATGQPGLVRGQLVLTRS